MACQECHHLPSGRFDAQGLQCYCKCHDKADNANAELQNKLKAFQEFLNLQIEEWTDQILLLAEFSNIPLQFKVLDSSGLALNRNFDGMILDFAGWQDVYGVVLKQPKVDKNGNLCNGYVTMDLKNVQVVINENPEINNAYGQLEALKRIQKIFNKEIIDFK